MGNYFSHASDCGVYSLCSHGDIVQNAVPLETIAPPVTLMADNAMPVETIVPAGLRDGAPPPIAANAHFVDPAVFPVVNEEVQVLEDGSAKENEADAKN